MNTNLSEMVVVVTGASSGIGRATALRFAGEGCAVVVTARREEALHNLVEDCRRVGARAALEVPADVTEEGALGEVARRAMEAFGRLDVWVNDAAVTALGAFEATPPEVFRRVIDTNLFGYVHGLRAALPPMRQQGRGVIVNVASIVGKAGQPMASAYAASKAAVVGLSESVRMELQDTPGIHLCTILPATIDTPLFQHAANYSGHEVQAPPPVYYPEQVADAIVQTVRRPRAEVIVGGAGRAIVALHKLAPGLAERLYARQVKKGHFKATPAEPTAGNVFAPMAGYSGSHGGWHAPPKKSSGMLTLGGAALGIGLGVWMATRQRRRQPPLASQ